MYKEKACVLESEVVINDMGVVNNITESCIDVFSVSKKKIIGKNIHCIFPEFLVKPHIDLTNKWSVNGNLSNLNVTREIFFVDQSYLSF